MKKLATLFKLDDTTPIQLKILSRQITGAQKRIEMQNFGIRKTVLKFDDVMNTQRTVIYDERNKVLDGYPVHDQIVNMFPDVIAKICEEHLDDDKPYYDWDLAPLNAALEKGLLPKDSNIVTEDFVEGCDVSDVEEKLIKIVDKRYAEKLKEAEDLGIDFGKVERVVMLRVVDSHWTNHIDDMQILKNEIFSRGFGNEDPVLAYKKDGYAMFDEMIRKIREMTCMILLNINFEVKKEEPVQRPTFTPVNRRTDLFEKPKKEKIEVQKTVVNTEKEIGRNDPCPCGSGKKYKNCCGANE